MRKGFAILLVALLCCGFIPQQIASRQNSNLALSQYTEALKLAIIHGDSTSARQLLHSVLECDSTYAPAMALMARLATNNGERIEYASRAYRADTSNLHYAKLYRNALVDARDYTSAIPLSYRLIERSTEPGEYYFLAVMLESKQRDNEAIAVLDTAYVRLGRISPLSRLRQYLLIKRGRPLEAENDALKGVEEEPYNPENYIALAEVYASTKRDSLALATYLRGIEADKDDLDLLISLSEFYHRRNRAADYLSILDKIFAHKELPVEDKVGLWKGISANTNNYRRFYTQYDALIKRLYILYPQNSEVVDLYIKHLIASGKIEEALQLCKVVAKRNNPPRVENFTRIIEIESHLERADSVAHYTKVALEAFPKSITLLQMRSFIATEKGEYDEAIGYLDKALQYADNDTLRSELWGTIGDVEHARNKMKRCYKAYDKALRYFGDNAMVLNNYAYFLSIEERSLERALEMSSRAINLSQNNATYLDTMAWVLYKLGRYAEAKKYMQQALSLDRSKSPEYSLHYGDILYALGEEFMAKTYWRKALEAGADIKEIEQRFALPTKKRE